MGLPIATRVVYSMDVGDYRRLEVWQRARVLTKTVYEMTASFPSAEKYGLTNQLRRAANSIGANIAEGIGRPSANETAHFLGIAIGSTNEVEQHLIVATDIGFVSTASTDDLMSQLVHIRRMLVGLRTRFAKRR